MRKSNRKKSRIASSKRSKRTDASKLDYNDLEPRNLLAGVTDLIELEVPVPLSESMQLLRSHLDLSENESMELIQITEDRVGNEHFKYQQTLNGAKVEGGVYTLHTVGSEIVRVSGEYKAVQDPIAGTTLSKEAALQSALDYVGATSYAWESEVFARDRGLENGPTHELLFMPVEDGPSELTYKFDVYAFEPFSRAYVYVDATSGEVTQSVDRIHEVDVPATGTSLYEGDVGFTADEVSPTEFRLRQAAEGVETFNLNSSFDLGTAADFTNGSTNFTDAAAQNGVQAHVAAETTYQYFLREHGRDSYDGLGSTLRSYTSYGPNVVNAFWTGSEMLYGDGDGVTYGPLTSLDIGGHEIGHGVTEFSADLIYANESGALNESFSDIFGTLVENYSRGSNDWLLGDDIGIGGSGAIRNMADPNAFGNADTYMGDFWVPAGGFDNGGVHFNSGVQNKWFFLMVEGEVGTNDNGENYNVTGMGIDDAAAIAYHNLTTYLSPGSTFQDARDGAVQSAKDIFGTCSSHVTTTREAWRAVGVSGGGSGLEISSLEHLGEATEMFRGGITSDLAAGGSSDITVCLDAGQRISVVVESSGGLQPSIQVLDPMDGVIGVGANNGNSALVQNARVDLPGIYTIEVNADNGTAGNFEVSIVLNGSIEAEPYATDNGSMANAENIDSSTLRLTPQVGERLGVVGEFTIDEATVTESDNFDSPTLDGDWATSSTDPQGRIKITGDQGTAGGSLAMIMDQRNEGVNNLNEAIWTVDLAGLADPILNFWHAEWNDETTVLPTAFNNSRNGDGVSVSSNGTTWYTILTDTDTSAGEWNQFSIDLKEFSDTNGLTLGGDLQVKFQQYDDGEIGSDGRGYDEISVNASAIVEDWYSFTLAANETATVAASKSNVGGTIEVELYDSNGVLLEGGSGFDSDNSDIVSRYQNTGATDLFFVKVSGQSTPYSLVTTVDADFETASNDSNNPQDISDQKVVLAHTAAFQTAGADPDEVAPGTVLDTFFEGVTFTDNVTGGPIYAVHATYNAPTGENIFSPSLTSDAGFREGVNEFRADFDTLQQQVSLDFGSDDGAADVGFFRALDVDGNVLAELTSIPLQPGQRQTLTISWFRPEIAAIVAGGVGNDVAPVDNLKYQLANDESDYFSFDLEANKLIEIRANLPGGGPLLSENGLIDFNGDVSLRMEVSDPSGNVVATGRDVVNLIPADTGQYTLKVSTVAGEGDYIVQVNVLPERIVNIGNTGLGIAVDDAATGTGFVMYSQENVFDRFSPFVKSSEHLIAVRYDVANATWEANENGTDWVDFDVQHGDRLIASVDFDADTITSLESDIGFDNGMNKGFRTGDLAFAADSWNSIANDGEFQITGSFFVLADNLESVAVGTTGNGIAVQDLETGTGYIMYSKENLNDRFSTNKPFITTSENMIAVRYNGVTGQWLYSDNSAWHVFEIAEGDRLIAAVDFDADSITSLQGDIGTVGGIHKGFNDSDLTFRADQWAGSSNDGEFQITGTFFELVAYNGTDVAVGDTGSGIAVEEGATGTGFIMFSEQNVFTRLASVFPTSATNLMVVQRDGGGNWTYNDNSTWVTFTPQAGDRLLANVDFDNDIVVALRTQAPGNLGGIDSGFYDGDLVFTPNFWAGIANDGEFGVKGTFFNA